jgi:hypothetical protein
MLSGCAPKRNFAGTWNGSVSYTLPTGGSMSLPLTFHVTKKDDGTYSSTVDVTSLKMTGLPVQSFTVDADKVTIAIQTGAGGFNFTGTTNADATEISGTMGQGKEKAVPLKLVKTPDAK